MYLPLFTARLGINRGMEKRAQQREFYKGPHVTESRQRRPHLVSVWLSIWEPQCLNQSMVLTQMIRRFDAIKCRTSCIRQAVVHAHAVRKQKGVKRALLP